MEEVKTQPQAIAPMKIGGNKNSLNCEIGADGKRNWSYGLFDCFGECGLCCWAAFCGCVVYGKNRQRLHHLQREGAALPGGGERYADHCMIYGLLAPCHHGWVLQVNQRTELRERYNIRGSIYEDLFSSWCCRSCSLTQERREIELEEMSLNREEA
ncbi:PLAC8 family-domain-containing protein [Lactifluus volemus]|nr:PLAC8 family-domain-containing protein [Lactifluus volemus]